MTEPRKCEACGTPVSSHGSNSVMTVESSGYTHTEERYLRAQLAEVRAALERSEKAVADLVRVATSRATQETVDSMVDEAVAKEREACARDAKSCFLVELSGGPTFIAGRIRARAGRKADQ